ncbi:MAG: hypothetical protein ACXVC0_07725 [Bdellovibrionota bacterium]
MLRFAFLLTLLLSLAPDPASGATIYVGTKSYPWDWGLPPTNFQASRSGGFRLRAWLEGQSEPKLHDATMGLRKETFRYFELENPVTVKYAVLGPPRSSSGHDPYFFAWIEWVSKSNFMFDLDERRFERKAGIAKIAIEGEGERNLEIREWHWEKYLKDAELEKVLPWDAAVVARKMLDFHAVRPRMLPENANTEAKHAPY